MCLISKVSYKWECYISSKYLNNECKVYKIYLNIIEILPCRATLEDSTVDHPEPSYLWGILLELYHNHPFPLQRELWIFFHQLYSKCCSHLSATLYPESQAWFHIPRIWYKQKYWIILFLFFSFPFLFISFFFFFNLNECSRY